MNMMYMHYENTKCEQIMYKQNNTYSLKNRYNILRQYDCYYHVDNINLEIV
jgi:hypothetical protein